MYNLTTRLLPIDMKMLGGLFTQDLLPEYLPEQYSVSREAAGASVWRDFYDPAIANRGFTQFDLALYWVGGHTDNNGIHHNFNYVRAYQFGSSLLMTSLEDITSYTQSRFFELINHPETSMTFYEELSSWSFQCNDDGQCTYLESSGEYHQGTFSFNLLTNVSAPSTLETMILGGLFAFGVRRKSITQTVNNR